MNDEIHFFTEHARVLLSIRKHPDRTVAEIAKALEISERQIFRMLHELQRAGLLTRAKNGRRNRYLLNLNARLHESAADDVTLLEFLATPASRAAGLDDEAELFEVSGHRSL
jgi:DNA-binding IclR family transcriptional regulator